jgi:hypothetical protein
MHGLYIDEALLNMYFKTTFNTLILKNVDIHLTFSMFVLSKNCPRSYVKTICTLLEMPYPLVLRYFWNFQCH